jgi:DNA mismatch repair ATPase MutS
MSQIVSRQDSVSTLYDSSNLSSLRSSLNGLTIDLNARLSKVSKGKGDLKCLYDTYVYVRALGNFEANLDDLESFKASISESRVKCENLLGLAEAVIDMDRAPREFVVRDGFDEDLTEINKNKEEVRKWDGGKNIEALRQFIYIPCKTK